MKFSTGRPKLPEIRAHIAQTWNLDTQPAVGFLDLRHATLHMGSASDTKRALACPSHKLNNSMFRLFRWTPDFEIGKDSTYVAVWVKFHNLPLHYYNESSLHRLGSTLGNVLRVHTDTLNLTQQVFAKVCIEMDITKPFVESVWIGTSKEQGWKIDVEYQGNQTYCTFCGLLGHTVGLCRKKQQIQGKAIVEEKGKTQTGEAPREKWVTKTSRKNNSNPGKNNAHTEKEITHPSQNNSTPREILQRPQDGITDATRQALTNAGLISDPTCSHNSDKNGNHGFEETIPLPDGEKDLPDKEKEIHSPEKILAAVEEAKEKESNSPEKTVATMEEVNSTQQRSVASDQRNRTAERKAAQTTTKKFDILKDLDEGEYQGDHASSNAHTEEPKDTQSDNNLEEVHVAVEYSQSDSEVNKDNQTQRRKYQKRRIVPSDRVTRSVAKQSASNQTC